MKYPIGLTFTHNNKNHEIFRFNSGRYHVWCRQCRKSFVYTEQELDYMINQ